MKLKKIPRYLALFFLTAGASLILGLLSFGGSLAVLPSLPIALTAFVLSVAYEGEIYLQNLTGALNKLFKKNYHERQLANEYLLQLLNDPSEKPEFFQEYDAQLALLHQFGDQRLDKKSRVQKKQIEKRLRNMEKWFATVVFSKPLSNESISPYKQELQEWLSKHEQSLQIKRLKKRRQTFIGVSVFSLITALFMGVGTSYLLMESFATLPFLASLSFTLWPALIIPMAIISGVAYGLLTYNTVTDMLTNNALRTWCNDLLKSLKKEVTWRNMLLTATTVFLISLAIALTICTAGTWWTIVKETRPLFAWMVKIPGFVMGVINPIIIGLSAIMFNLQNTSESLQFIKTMFSKNNGHHHEESPHEHDNHHDHNHAHHQHGIKAALKSIKTFIIKLREHEHWVQVINPFRLLLTCTVTPLRVILFVGHLLSIGVALRLSAILGIISEGFEDLHYFVPHSHKCSDSGHTHGTPNEIDKKELREHQLASNHGHNHDLDLPSRLLKLIFSPLYLLATVWDYCGSRWGNEPKHPLTFKRAWEKQNGIREEATVELPTHQEPNPWLVEHAVDRINEFSTKVTGSEKTKLTDLKQTLSQLDRAANEETVNQAITTTYGFFAQQPKTPTAHFLEELPRRLGSIPHS